MQAERSVAAMYSAAMEEARRRAGAVPAADMHALALLAPRLSYPNLCVHACADGPRGEPALARMLEDAGPDGADELIVAALAFRRDGGGSPGGVGDPGRSASAAGGLAWLKRGLQAWGMGAGEAAEAQQRCTAPLSPLAHGLFMLQAEHVLRLMPADAVALLASAAQEDRGGERPAAAEAPAALPRKALNPGVCCECG